MMKKNVPILTKLYLSLFLHIITSLLVAARDSPPIYTPVEEITVICGSSGNVLDKYDERYWRGDINSNFSPTTGSDTSMFRKAPHSYKVQPVPYYTTARLSHSEFTYRFFNLTPGQKFVRLYFYPASYPDFDPSKAFFSVKAGGFTLLHDFNASVTAAASGLEETVYREFCMNIEEEEEHSLSITFTPSRAIPDAYAFINGIEIVSMPVNLYYTAPESAREIKYISNESTFRLVNSSALEMVYRINVGGSAVPSHEDTGMYRKWYDYTYEERYLEELSSKWSVLPPQNLSIQPKWDNIPAYSAPKQVYQSGRSMGNNNFRNQHYNLTWQFPVDPKFSYLVRLHFCEFQPEITEIGSDRVFQIYIANITAEKAVDIIDWSGGNGIPIYKDYLVFMPAGSEKKVNLSIALQANPHWRTRYLDAILNGLEIFKVNDTKGNLAGPNPDPPHATLQTPAQSRTREPKSKTTPLVAIVAGVVSSALVVISVLCLFFILRRRRNYGGRSSHHAANSTKSRGSSLPSDLCHYFSLAEIKAATQNFNDVFIIGVGGFGHVYKGNINLADGGTTPVAIKRLKPESSQGAVEFKTEIEMLSQLRHLHLVPLIGYCTDEGEMILVYDYMAHGTLRDHLYNTNNPPLPWDKRLEICIGAARGLHYLHTGAKYKIIHRDVKSTNILLDEKWVAKVSDFGLSKMGPTTVSKTHISTMVKGSFGYLDPEYFRRNQVTEKSDVYSFGVLLCEVLCARPALIRTALEKKQISLAEWAKSYHRRGELGQIVDPSLKGEIGNACLNKFADIAVSCMHDNGIERPSMNDVVGGLEFALQLHQKADQGDSYFNVENKGEDEVVLMNGKDGAGFSCSWEKLSDSITKTSSSEEKSTTNESIKGMSRTIFSGIDDHDGR
ncbi:unnamed protein product [Prunus armeniaca]